MFKVKDLFSTLENGATKIDIYCPETGELLFRGIWFNEAKPEVLDRVVSKINVTDYYLKVDVI